MKSKKVIPTYKPFVPKESIDNVVKTLNTTWIGGDGPKVKEFEKKLSKIVGNQNLLALNSGTSALHLALRLANVSGGEVITTPMTCFATNAPIVNEGAKIVWADIDPKTGNIDPADIEHRITKKTKAIMIVDWGGSPCDIGAINKISKKHKLPVIRDAAQSLGSEYDGKPVGVHCDYVCISTQAIKIINTADGGILITKKKSDYNRAKNLRWYGIDREGRKHGPTFWNYPISEAGFKLQMTDVAASIGLGQLPYLKRLIRHRRKLAKIFTKAISKSQRLTTQKIHPKAKSNYWLYTVLCGSIKTRISLHQALLKINVIALEAHQRNDTYPVFRKYKKDKLPGVTKFNQVELIIPNGYWVTENNAHQIAKVLSSF